MCLGMLCVMTHLISASDPEIAGSTNVLAEDPARAAKGENGHFEPLGAQQSFEPRRGPLS